MSSDGAHGNSPTHPVSFVIKVVPKLNHKQDGGSISIFPGFAAVASIVLYHIGNQILLGKMCKRSSYFCTPLLCWKDVMML
jgi:hypothetical protein